MTMDEPSESLVAAVENLDVDTDVLHEILSDGRRRYTLARLHESVKPMHLGDLAKEIAEWEGGQAEDEDQHSAEAVHQALYHIHVAKMADAGLVDYDGLRDTVSLVDDGHVLAAQLTPAADV